MEGVKQGGALSYGTAREMRRYLSVTTRSPQGSARQRSQQSRRSRLCAHANSFQVPRLLCDCRPVFSAWIRLYLVLWWVEAKQVSPCHICTRTHVDAIFLFHVHQLYREMRSQLLLVQSFSHLLQEVSVSLLCHPALRSSLIALSSATQCFPAEKNHRNTTHARPVREWLHISQSILGCSSPSPPSSLFVTCSSRLCYTSLLPLCFTSSLVFAL